VRVRVSSCHFDRVSDAARRPDWKPDFKVIFYLCKFLAFLAWAVGATAAVLN
jgi:hypothetical protein